MKRKYIIYADSFDENVGGIIALHRLCDLLNKAGEQALIWPGVRPLFNWRHPLRSLNRQRKYRRWQSRHRFNTLAAFDTPLAGPSDLAEAVVVYGEMIDGNPLQSKRVVRWLLHRPGFHTGRINYGPDDRYFFYQHAFNDPELNPDADNLLRTMFVRTDVYQEHGQAPRQGSCHLIRKGKGRPFVHEPDSILLDGMSHADMAAVFNRVRCCVSYDTYSMYSLYAAMCGCVSIVVPEEGVSKTQWYPDERDRYGLAYGFDDIEHAERTRHLVLPRLKELEDEANASVRHFIARCEQYFGAPAGRG